MAMSVKGILCGVFIWGLIFVSGCDGEGPNAGSAVPQGKALPSVVAAVAYEQDYVVTATEIGEVKSEDSVDLVARVSGFLTSGDFKEGSFVKKGTVLFTIDPAEYEAGVRKAKGLLEQAQADQKNATLEYQRQKLLLEKNAVAQKEYDLAEAAKLEADAAVHSAEADLKLAELNLGYTRIVAPFDGWVGFKTYSTGNLVGSQSEKLATIEKSGQAKVNFEISEMDLLRLNDYLKSGRKRTEVPVEIFDQTGRKIPLKGSLSAWDNRINPTTGTLKLQARFDDPDRRLMPGLYVKVKIQVSEPQKFVMVRESAVTNDVAGSYVMLIVRPEGNTGTVERRYIKTGGKQDGRIQVKEGLNPGELVIVAGLQKVRPGMECRFTVEGRDPAAAGNVGTDGGGAVPEQQSAGQNRNTGKVESKP